MPNNLKKKRKIDTVQLLRFAVQVVSFILLPALFVGAYGGVRALVSSLIHHTALTAAQAPDVIASAVVIPATVLLGRFFCGWMCAFGAFGDFIHLTFGRFVKFKVPEKLDKALKSVKYILLAFLIIAGWWLGAKVFSAANPWDAFGMLATVGQAPNFDMVLSTLLPAFVLLVVIAVGSVFVERFFCRYFCPLGAVFTITSRLRILKIRKPNDKCGKCRVCTNQCAMGISLYKMNTVSTGECIGCMKCVNACPRKNVSVAIAGADIQPLAAGLLATAAIAGTYVIANVSPATASGSDASLDNVQSTAQVATATEEPESSISKQLDAMTETPAQSTAAPQQTSQPTATAAPAQTTQSASIYKDGTYTGSGRGYRGTTKMQVTIQNDVITAVKSVSTRDDGRFFNAAYSTIVGEVLQAQSPQVDTVSGATYSSNGIISAVTDALNQAKA